MSERAINELRNQIAAQAEVIEHLLVRSELSLHLLFVVLPKGEFPVDAVKQKIEQFKYDSPSVSPNVLEIEKRKIIKIL